MIKIKPGYRYLVTGGSGFLGELLTHEILKREGVPVILARNEGKVLQLRNRHPEVQYFFGDVADPFVVQRAMAGCKGCFHLAGFKHVIDAEVQPYQCLLSNVTGSLNVCRSAVDLGLEFVICTSTDKVAKIAGVYGATKLLMEKLFWEFDLNTPGTEFRVVRYGNVLHSTGSVLVKWKMLIDNDQPLKISDPLATRFYWTREQAVSLIFQCLEEALTSNPWVPKMKSVKLADLATAFLVKHGKSVNYPIQVTGLQEGENLHELIIAGGLDSYQSQRWTISELVEVL